MYGRGFGGSPTRRGGGLGGRLMIFVVMALIAIAGYYFGTARVPNDVTGEVQRVAMTPSQEIALGLQAVPEMEQQYGGQLADPQAQALVDQVGNSIVQRSQAGNTAYQFDFHLLADPQTVNAFALPGGQVFMTAALYQALETEGQLAGVLAHEIGHVVARHAAEQIAKSQLVEGISGAAAVAAYDPNNPSSIEAARMAQLVGQMVTLKYSRADELQSDQLSVRFMADAGYDPRTMIRVMQILEATSTGQAPPEFFSSHPNPENRIQQIQAAIDAEFPNGVPDGLVQ